MDKKTSWGSVAVWYDDLLENNESTYQKDLILPNLKRLMEVSKSDRILDLACGQGFFSRAFQSAGAKVVGTDVSPELLEIAKKRGPEAIEYRVSPADDLHFLKNESVNKAVIVLALQNIENIKGVFEECARVLQKNGLFYIVLNHPCFRVPKDSSWGYDEKTGIQYRRVDSYISERKEKIQMWPGDAPEEFTLSFHRPLQYYFKALSKSGFAVARVEEWTSGKKSQPGPRAKAENTARKEIPLFIFLEARKII